MSFNWQLPYYNDMSIMSMVHVDVYYRPNGGLIVKIELVINGGAFRIPIQEEFIPEPILLKHVELLNQIDWNATQALQTSAAKS